jgi:hypothetical protein
MLQTAIIDTQQAIDVINHVNWFQPTWDLFIVLFFIVASLIYGMSLGRDRIVVILMSIYISLAIVNYVPFVKSFSTSISVNDAFAIRVSVFLGIFILLFFFLSHSALIKTIGRGTQGKFIHVMIFSFLHVGLLISVMLSFFPVDLSTFLSPLTRELFVSDIAKAAWVITPVIAMAVFGDKSSNEN